MSFILYNKNISKIYLWNKLLITTISKNMNSIKKLLIYIAIIWSVVLIFYLYQVVSSTPKENRFTIIIVLILSILMPLIAIISQHKLYKSIFSMYPEHQKKPISEINKMTTIILAALLTPITIAVMIFAFLLK